MAISEDQEEQPENWFCLIRDGQRTLGYIPLDFITDSEDQKHDGPADGAVGDYCTPITPDQMVPASMPLLDLIPLFRQHYFYFALTRNEITHVVSFVDLDKLPMKLCLFSLVMALEAEIIKLLSAQSGGSERHLRLLPDERRRKAEELCRVKYGDRTTADRALLCTTFIDKKTMLVRDPQLFGQLPFQSNREGEEFFSRVERLRNQIAHSDSILTILASPDEFDGFLTQLKQVTENVSMLQES